MNIGNFMPFVAMGVLAVVGIGLLVAFMMKKYKKKPLTPAAIPPLPSQKEAAAHFSPLPQASTVASIHPHPKNATSKKKVIAGLIATAVIVVVLAVSFFVSRAKPQTIKKEAAVTGLNDYVHRENTVGEVRGNTLVAGGKFGYYSDIPVNPSPTPINVTVDVKFYHCPAVNDPNITTCATATGTGTQNAVLNWGDRQVEIVAGVDMTQQCGLYQIESSYDPYNPTETTPGEAGTAYYNWGRACDGTAVPSSTSSAALVLTPTTTPTTSNLVLTATPVTSAQITSPTPTPTSIPTPTAIATPTPTAIVTATPTPTIITLSITPTPTEIILVQTATSPTPTVIASAPTIPAAGTPASLLIMGIPLLIILLAFVL